MGKKIKDIKEWFHIPGGRIYGTFKRKDLHNPGRDLFASFCRMLREMSFVRTPPENHWGCLVKFNNQIYAVKLEVSKKNADPFLGYDVVERGRKTFRSLRMFAGKRIKPLWIETSGPCITILFEREKVEYEITLVMPHERDF